MPAHDGDVKAAKAGLCFPERPPLLIRFPIGRIRPVSIAALVPLDAAPPCVSLDHRAVCRRPYL